MDHFSNMYAQNAQAIADQLRQTINTTTKSKTVAGVNTSEVSQVYLGNLDPVIIQHTAASGANEIIRIGDYGGVVARANSVGDTTEFSDSGNQWTAQQLAYIAEKGLLIAQINYVVSNNDQFAQPFRYLTTDASGASGGRDIKGRFAESQRSTDQNLLVKTLDLSVDGKQLLLNPWNALFITVKASRSVTITLSFGGSVQ